MNRHKKSGALALGIALIMMITIVVLIVFLISPTLSTWQIFRWLDDSIPTPISQIATPSPSPTPIPTEPPTATPKPAPFISGSSAYLIDADSNRVLYDMNSRQQLPMASTTKIMTAIVAIENGNLDQGVNVEQAELNEMPSGSSNAGLIVGDYFRIRTLLYGLLLRSGTDASIVIAHTISGTTANFVALMNKKAQSLQLTHTHFNNPHGFGGSNHYTTAQDLVKLTNYALRNPLFAQIVATRSYDVPPTQYTHAYHWNTTNDLLNTYNGADGVKTGWTDAAGHCLVFSAHSKGHHLIGVELNSPTYEELFADGARLLDLGFSKI